MRLSKIAAAIVGVVVISAGFAAVSPPADAAVKTKRCAWWELQGTDELVIDAIGGSTTCHAARAVGDAYLDSPKWFPKALRAAGKTWRLIPDAGDYNGAWKYRAMQYQARSSLGAWQSVYLTFQWK
jgi:hypothetical protein